MKILPISDCKDCPNYRWIALNYSFECGLTYEQIRYKEIGVDEALMELFNQCPLEEYPNSEIKLLNAFIVEKNLAVDYIRWRKGSGDD